MHARRCIAGAVWCHKRGSRRRRKQEELDRWHEERMPQLGWLGRARVSKVMTGGGEGKFKNSNLENVSLCKNPYPLQLTILNKHGLEPPSDAPAVIQPLEPSRRRQSRGVPKASHLCIAPRRLAELLEPCGGSEGGAARLPLQLPRRRGGGGGRPCSRPCSRPAEQRAPGMCRVCAWRVHGVRMAGCATCVDCAA